MEELTPQQKEAARKFTAAQANEYNTFRVSGFPPATAFQMVVGEAPQRPGTTRSQDGVFTGENSLASAGAQAVREVAGGFARIGQDFQQYGARDAALQAPARILGGIGRGAGAAFGGVLETADDIALGGIAGRTLAPIVQSVVETQPAQDVISYLESVNEAGRGIPGDILSALEIIPAAGATRLATQGVRTAQTATRQSLRDMVRRPVAETTAPITPTAAAREVAETTAPSLSAGERWIGLTTDVRRRIAGKQDKMQEYIDVAKTRNVDDTAPTPYEFGAQRAQQAVSEMETLLNESGGRIGATREKLGTYQANVDQIKRIEDTFNTQLARLNLEQRSGTVRQKAGTVAKAGAGDINALNEILQNLLVVKQSPTLTNLIEFRSSVDSRINFGKRASEVSNEVDPLARQIRKSVADVGADIVGKTEAAELARFSEFMDAYNDLRSYTDRRAGGEYLLRVVLSGRGGDARKIIDTIKEYTGIDLMDDATMMTLVTDSLGNQAQKNLFRQEITNAGLDAANILSGNPVGIFSTAVRRGGDAIFDAERVLLEAAR